MARRTKLALVATCVFAATPAQAEEADPRLAVQGGVGFGQVWSDESLLGSGASFEASVEARVLPKLGIQVGVSRYSHERKFPYPSNVRFSGDSLMLSADVLYHFQGTRVFQPFLLGGVARFETRNRSSYPMFAYDGWLLLPRQVGEEVVESSEEGVGLTVGGGAELPLTSTLAVRTEARFVFPRKLSASAALSFRF
jgi:opacity protein-like surface antigen